MNDTWTVTWTKNGVFVRPPYSKEGAPLDFNECFVFNDFEDFQKWAKRWWKEQDSE